LAQSLACWMLSRVRESTGNLTLRELQLGLNALETASAHFTKCLKFMEIEKASSSAAEIKQE